ncbi:unnamed protein product, partial [Lymnaea stagnalis]
TRSINTAFKLTGRLLCLSNEIQFIKRRIQTMFAVIGIVITVQLVSLSQAQESSVGKPCTSSFDCGVTGCCLKSPQSGGSFCAPMIKEHQKCYVSNDRYLMSFGHTVFNKSCPCDFNLRCDGTLTQPLTFEHIDEGTCRDVLELLKEWNNPHYIKKDVSGSCSSGKDCSADECCVSAIQPIGRKKRLAIGRGACQKLGETGDSCLVSVTTAADMNWECPCVSGLTCKGQGLFEVPLGERGKLSFFFFV